MTVFEITLLILGLLAFAISFFIPDKQNNDEYDNYAEDEIRKIIDDEVENMRDKLTNSADETINYSVEKAERSLERISNEKMISLGEYSDTILNQINKNHQEAVFLYDMLTKSKNDLTVLLGQAVTDSKRSSEIANNALNLSKEAEKLAAKALENAKETDRITVLAEDKLIMARKNVSNNVISSNPSENFVNSDIKNDITISADSTAEVVKKPPVKRTTRKKKEVSEPVLKDGVLMDNDGQISLKFDTDNENGKNSNDKVLRLHKQGKSNVAIAKELGLGIGEVKLVIDLFENKK